MALKKQSFSEPGFKRKKLKPTQESNQSNHGSSGYDRLYCQLSLSKASDKKHWPFPVATLEATTSTNDELKGVSKCFFFSSEVPKANRCWSRIGDYHLRNIPSIFTSILQIEVKLIWFINFLRLC